MIAAAVLWVLDVGFRLALQLSTHGGCGDATGRFSARHDLGLVSWTSAIMDPLVCSVGTSMGWVSRPA
jgi:hypothetical protein